MQPNTTYHTFARDRQPDKHTRAIPEIPRRLHGCRRQRLGQRLAHTSENTDVRNVMQHTWGGVIIARSFMKYCDAHGASQSVQTRSYTPHKHHIKHNSHLTVIDLRLGRAADARHRLHGLDRPRACACVMTRHAQHAPTVGRLAR
jgi:hypothetical protein